MKAFPSVFMDYLPKEELRGMDLRDYFAAKAMAALMMGCFVGELDEIVAKAAYETADAMMKAREK